MFISFQSFANSKYYKGGFESKMTRREASLILGISPTASKIKVKVIRYVHSASVTQPHMISLHWLRYHFICTIATVNRSIQLMLRSINH